MLIENNQIGYLVTILRMEQQASFSCHPHLLLHSNDFHLKLDTERHLSTEEKAPIRNEYIH